MSEGFSVTVELTELDPHVRLSSSALRLVLTNLVKKIMRNMEERYRGREVVAINVTESGSAPEVLGFTADVTLAKQDEKS